MKKNIRLIALTVCAALLTGGCAIHSRPPAALYDLGPPQATAASALPHAEAVTVSVAEIDAPAWLDSSLMYYRLAYDDAQQPLPYAGSRWAGSPAAMFGQRLKARIAQAGGVALSASDSASNVPVLHIEADDFMQTFSGPGDSMARVAMRASLLKGRTLIAQKTFVHESPAHSADAAGGAHALAAASDAVIMEIISWLNTLPTAPAK